MFDFSKTDSAKAGNFINPGVYKLKVVKVEGGDAKSGSKYAAITLKSQDGKEITEKFYLTEGAIGRLQYFHEAATGEKCNKVFKSEAEIVKYFNQVLVGQKTIKRFIVGGEINAKGQVYSNLPFTNFIDNEEKYELGAFDSSKEEKRDPNSLWNQFVKESTLTSDVEKKEQGILNSSDDDNFGDGNDNDDDDLPFDEEEKPKTKKTADTNTKKSSKPAPKAKTKKKDEEEDDFDNNDDNDDKNDDDDDTDKW